MPASETLQLKKGAQVMLLANVDLSNGLANGSRGVVVDWIPYKEALKEAPPDGRTNRSGGGFGSEEWRERAVNEFIDEQESEMVPVVFFATGVTCAFPVSCRHALDSPHLPGPVRPHVVGLSFSIPDG